MYDINDAGHAVGRSYNDDLDSRAVYWDGTTLHDLNDLLPTNFTGVLYEAREINRDGDIVGSAVVDGEFRAFLLTVGAPCPGDVDGSGEVEFNDIVALLAAWGPCVDCPADLDANGDVNFDDLVNLLAAWGPCS